MLFFLFFLSMMTDSQAKSYKKEQKFLSEHPNNILSGKDTHPKYRPSKYMKEATALTDMENQIIVKGIEEYTRTIDWMGPEEPVTPKRLQQVEDSKKLYQKTPSNPKNLNAKILEKNSCGALMQSVNGGACNLYSFLGAALSLDAFRKKLKKLIVNEDENNVYIKFPYLGPSNAPQKFKETFDTVYKVSKEIYSSTVGTLLPSEDFWVQAISRAFYERLNTLESAARDGYDLIYPTEIKQKTVHLDYFFGTKVKILDIMGPLHYQ